MEASAESNRQAAIWWLDEIDSLIDHYRRVSIKIFERHGIVRITVEGSYE